MWPIIGHEWAVELLAHGIRSQKQSHAYLLVGPAHVGKMTLARALAQAVNCLGDPVPCGECRSCHLVQADRHPDVHVIAPQNNRIKIEAIREMQRSVSLAPVEARYRVCLIERIDQATTSAANSLLKTLEEPPSRVILVLTADRPESLLPTIVSRCQVLPLRLLSVERVISALRARGVEGERARLLGHLSKGRIGWAISASADKRVLAQRTRILERLAEVMQGTYTARFSWAEKLSKKPDQIPDVLNILASWWRDVLLLASDSQTPITNVDRASELDEWAVRYSVRTAKEVLCSIRDTSWRLEHNANVRLALEVLMLDMPAAN